MDGKQKAKFFIIIYFTTEGIYIIVYTSRNVEYDRGTNDARMGNLERKTITIMYLCVTVNLCNNLL